MLATLDYRTDIPLLFAEWDAQASEREEIKRLLEMDEGDQIKSTPGMPHESGSHQRTRPRFAARFLTALLNKLSYLYASDPVRESTLEGVWERVLWKWGPGLTPIMRQIDREARLTGTVLAVMDLGSSEPPTRDGKGPADGIEVWPMTPDRWVSLEHPQDRRYPACVLIHHSDRVVMERIAGGTEVPRVREVFVYLDDTYRITITGRDVSSAVIEEHGFGTLPAAICSNTQKTVDLRGFRIGGEDLRTNLHTIAQTMEEIIFTGQLQRGQPCYAEGAGKVENLALGPDVPIKVADIGGFWFAQNGANITAMLETLNAQLEALAIGEGLPPGTLTVRESQTPSNAGVVAAMQLELQQDRNVREGQARQWELNLARVASKVWAKSPAANGRELPTNWKIIYTRLPEPLTHGEKMAEAKFLRDSHAIDRLGAIRLVQPHLSRREAEAQRDAGVAEFERERELQVAVAGHAESLPAVGIGETVEITETSTEVTE